MVADGLLIGGEEFGEAELVVDGDVHPGTTREDGIGSATGFLSIVIIGCRSNRLNPGVDLDLDEYPRMSIA